MVFSNVQLDVHIVVREFPITLRIISAPVSCQQTQRVTYELYAQLPETIANMRVVEIVIDGFKSYAVRTVISGWDESFNSITGLNGSGKSNILDAICFCLGITSMSTVRAQNIQVCDFEYHVTIFTIR